MSKNAIIFPGQGAQAVGMGKDLVGAFPECKALFDQANAALGFDLAKLCFEGPIEELTKSSNAQPAIFVTSLACYAAFRKMKPGVPFGATAGLSSGEWTALHVAGAVSFEDVLKVLQARGRFMQEACEAQSGGMLSVIGLDESAVREVCAMAGIEMANLNSPEQTVLSGRKEGIEKAEGLVKEAGAKRGIRLNVAGAFHSSLMAPAAGKLEETLAGVKFSSPTMPVVSNVTGTPHTTPDSIRRLMVQQVTSSVQWVSTVRWMQGQGIKTYVECGPGKVLTGLVKRIDNAAVLNNIHDRSSLESVVAAFGNA
jgi:[acyl-carrier-protein] S-malonyltransferase